MTTSERRQLSSDSYIAMWDNAGRTVDTTYVSHEALVAVLNALEPFYQNAEFADSPDAKFYDAVEETLHNRPLTPDQAVNEIFAAMRLEDREDSDVMWDIAAILRRTGRKEPTA